MRKHYHISYRHRRIRRRDVQRAMLAIGATFLVLLIAVFLIRCWEDKTYFVDNSGIENQTEEQKEDITYKGKVYTPKKKIETYLFMGIDVQGPAVSTPGAYNGGQADAQFLLVLDHEEKSWQLLRLNRDSMVEVPVLDLKGKVIGYERQQLALAHAYGDGTRMSCENVADTVSALLGNQTIDGYVSLNMDGIAVFNDAIGGVTVTITSDFTAVDPTLVEGETITLNGQQAMEFVRTRKDVDDQTNLARMERQRVYLEAIQPKLRALSDDEILRTYDALSDYIVSNLGSQNILNMAEYLKSYREMPELTIDGINTIEEGHVAYILDQDSLQQVILELFYQEKVG